MDIDKLIALEEDEFADQFGWIDWREDDAAVVETFGLQLTDTSSIGYVQQDGEITVQYGGKSHPIPLTHTGCDRYVVLSSLAELLSDTHEVWLHKASTENDTHGILVLSRSASRLLEEKHAPWVKDNLQRLVRGVDGFSGLEIPYLGHEERAREFDKAYRELASADEERNLQIQRLAADSEEAVRTYRKKQRIELAIAVLVLTVLVWMAFLKPSEPDCRVRVDGECMELIPE